MSFRGRLDEQLWYLQDVVPVCDKHDSSTQDSRWPHTLRKSPQHMC